MGKEEVVAAAVVSIQAAEAQALSDGLSSVYDAGLASAPVTDGTFTQADIDAAVAAKGVLDQAAIDDITAKLAALQTADDALKADDEALKAVNAGLQDVIEHVKALLFPPAA